MRERLRKVYAEWNSDLIIRIVTGLSLVGVVAVFAAIFCMAVHTSALTNTDVIQSDKQLASDVDTTGSSAGIQGVANFDAGKIRVSASLGIRKGQVYRNKYAPYHVDLENNGKNFEGYFRIYSGTERNSSMFQKKVSIAKGESKRIDSVFVPSENTMVIVALCDKKGEIIEKKTVTLQVSTATTTEKETGILSEDASNLGYFTGANFNASELSKEDIMEDARGLDIYDVLVVNNIDTQSLSDKQIAAINMWVKNGGCLILGTGAQADKTLKAFSGNLLNGTIGSTRTIQTQFGDYDSRKVILERQLEKDLYDEKISAVRKFLNDNLSTNLKNMYYEEIKNLDYQDSWKNTILSPGTEIYKELSSRYSEEELEDVFDIVITGEEKKDLQNHLNAEPITKDVTTLTIENSKSLLSQDNEQMISKLDYGDGSVIVAEFDLSLENQYWDSYGAMLKTLFYQNSIGSADIFTNMSISDDSDYYSASLTEGLKINEASELPNMALYLFLLLLYVAFIGPVSYVFLRRKDKRNLLWIIVPVSSVLCSVIIYLIGTSTRIQKPYVNYLSQIYVNGDGTAQLGTAFSITSPNNNAYRIELEGNMDVRPLSENDWYADYNNQEDNRYTYGIEYGADYTTLHMDHMSAFEGATLWNKQTLQQTGQIKFSGLNLTTSSPSGIVTNQMGYDLEDCVIVFEGNIIYLGDLAEDKSISLDKVRGDAIVTYNRQNDDWSSTVRKILRGDTYYESRDTKEARREVLLNYYGSLYLQGDDFVPGVYFYGFRAGDETPFNKLFSLEQYGETAVMQEITSEDMLGEGEKKVGVLSDYTQDQTGAELDDPQMLDIFKNGDGNFKTEVTVVYDLAGIKKKYGSLTAKYLSEDNKEFRLYTTMEYVSGSNVFVGTISVKNPKNGKMEHWADAGKEATLNLKEYMDDKGKLTVLYTVQSQNGLAEYIDGLQLPVIQIVGK